MIFAVMKMNGMPNLKAFDIKKKMYYDLGNVPEDMLTVAGGNLCSISRPDIGNLSLLKIEAGRVIPVEIELNYPYPYSN